MSIEECVQWCIDHEVDVRFARVEVALSVFIYSDLTDGSLPIGEGDSLVESVQDAMRASE